MGSNRAFLDDDSRYDQNAAFPHCLKLSELECERVFDVILPISCVGCGSLAHWNVTSH